jgi:hypothetical protein
VYLLKIAQFFLQFEHTFRFALPDPREDPQKQYQDIILRNADLVIANNHNSSHS